MAALPLRALDLAGIDPTYTPTITNQSTFNADAIVVQPDGKILIGGAFDFANGTLTAGIARVNADGSADPTFFAEADTEIPGIALQPDGKIIVGGYFSQINGVARRGIARLNADGSVDPSFDPGSGIANSDPTYAGLNAPSSVAVQADGKILIGGNFDHYNGVANTGLVRLNADGSLDPSFQPVFGGGFNFNALNQNQTIIVQPDGKILIAGTFSSVNGTTRPGLARLNADGSLDTGFSPLTGAYCLALQPDGKVLAGTATLVRFNSDGSLDTSFSVGAVFTSYEKDVEALAVQADGRILAVGSFSTHAGGDGLNDVARFNADGSLDTTFSADTTVASSDQDLGYFPTSAVAALPDGRSLIGGYFITVNGVALPTEGIALLAADGTPDPTFGPPLEAGGSANGVGLDHLGRMVAGGNFTLADGVARNGLARFNPDGSLDPSFNAADGDFLPDPTAEFLVTSVTVQPDDKVLYTAFKVALAADAHARRAQRPDSVPVPRLTTPTSTYLYGRRNADGSADTTFNLTLGSSSESVTHFFVQPDGKILVSGLFSSVGGMAAVNFARLNADGSPDGSFQSPALGNVTVNGATSSPNVNTVIFQPDGKILIAGEFSLPGSSAAADLARLNADGSLDSTFHPALPFAPMNYVPRVSSIALLPDGSILASGEFSDANYAQQAGLARLKADGSLDATYQGPAVDATAIFPQADGTTILVTHDDAVFGPDVAGVVRLLSDGTLDPSYTPITINDRSRSTVVPELLDQAVQQADGKIIIGGLYDLVNDATHTALVRIGAAGAVQFSASAYSVDENAGSVTVTVGRIGDSVGAASVAYATSDGTALAGTDYEAASGTLTWADGDTTPKSFRVPTLDRGLTDGSTRTFSVLLSAPNDVTLGTPSNATVTITENDVFGTLPVVNLTAKQTPVYESDAIDRGVFRIIRTGGDLSQPLYVNVMIKGKAKNGTDYTIGNVPAGATEIVKRIKIGKTKKKIHITPINLGITGNWEAGIKMTLLPGDTYTVGTKTVAHVKLVHDH